MSNTAQCTIYLVRHGQSESNLANIFGGNGKLTDLGIQQAKAVGEKFKDITFSTIYCSELIRAQQTAHIIAEKHNYPVVVRKALRERYFGTFEGRPVTQDIHDMLSTLIEKAENLIWSHHFNDEDESNQEALDRFTNDLQEIAGENLNKTIMVISHGNLMRSLLVQLGFGKYSELRGGTIENTGGYVLTWDGLNFKLGEMWGVDKRTIPLPGG